MSIQKEFNYVNRKINIVITRIAGPCGHPNILAEFITGQLNLRNMLIQKEFKYKL